MKRAFPWSRFIPALISCACVSLTGLTALADEVQMQNGDRYVGRVLTLNSNSLTLQSEVLGTLRLPRGKVATVQFGILDTNRLNASGTNILGQPALAAPANGATPAPQLSAALRQLGTQTNLIQQVQKQFLADAGPEANAKFNELVAGLMTGQMDLSGLRAQAQTAADQLRNAKGDMGAEAGGMLDSYLAILDTFLKETASETNSSLPRPAAK